MFMSRQNLAKKIKEVAYLRGRFRLRSGQWSDEYFDKYRIESQPDLLRSACYHMSTLVPPETQVLAGLELGGVPLATGLSLQTGLPAVFVRKQAKEYGTCQVVEGLGSLQGKYVLVVEDVITTGGQVLASIQDLQQQGAHIVGVLCLILRGTGAEIQRAGFAVRAVLTMDEIKNELP